MPKSMDRMIELIEKVETSVSLIRSGKEQDVINELLKMVEQMEESPTDRNQLQNKIFELEHHLGACQSERDSISCKLAQFEINKDKLNKLLGKRVGIIGGHVTDIRKIETMLDHDLGIKSKATGGEGSPPPYAELKDKYCKVDLLIILNGYAGHALTGSAERLSDEFGIPKVYDSADLLNSIKLKVIEALA